MSKQRDRVPESIGERASKLILIAFADLVDQGLIAIVVDSWTNDKEPTNPWASG